MTGRYFALIHKDQDIYSKKIYQYVRLSTMDGVEKLHFVQLSYLLSFDFVRVLLESVQLDIGLDLKYVCYSMNACG